MMEEKRANLGESNFPKALSFWGVYRKNLLQFKSLPVYSTLSIRFNLPVIARHEATLLLRLGFFASIKPLATPRNDAKMMEEKRANLGESNFPKALSFWGVYRKNLLQFKSLPVYSTLSIRFNLPVIARHEATLLLRLGFFASIKPLATPRNDAKMMEEKRANLSKKYYLTTKNSRYSQGH